MTTWRDTLKATLTGDATLTALLTGGVYDAEDLPLDMGGAEFAPRDTDGVTILPFAVIAMGASNGYQPEAQKIGAERETFEVYVYQNTGYSVIEQAITRLQTLLDDQYFNPTDRAIAHVLFTYTSPQLSAAALGGRTGRFSRYQVITIRK